MHHCLHGTFATFNHLPWADQIALRQILVMWSYLFSSHYVAPRTRRSKYCTLLKPIQLVSVETSQLHNDLELSSDRMLRLSGVNGLWGIVDPADSLVKAFASCRAVCSLPFCLLSFKAQRGSSHHAGETSGEQAASHSESELQTGETRSCNSRGMNHLTHRSPWISWNTNTVYINELHFHFSEGVKM